MHRPLSHRWAAFVTTRWWLVVLVWIVIAVAIRLVAPSWKEVAYDGDFEYLPSQMSSVAGGHLLDEAFPGERARSQVVLVLGRETGSLSKRDEIVGLDLLRRLQHRLGEVSWQRAIEYGYEGGPPVDGHPSAPWLRMAREAFDQSIAADDSFYEKISEQVPPDDPTPQEPRMAISYYDRGKLLEAWEESPEAIEDDFESALVLMEQLPERVKPIEERDLGPWKTMIDVFSWDDKVVGPKLKADGAQLAVMQLSSELAATSNIATIEEVQRLLDRVMQYSGHFTDPGLRLHMTGSAAIGGETLLAARDAIQYTEWITVFMILLILAVVYRAPLLVAIPMISIGFAVLVAMSLVALLTDLSMRETIPGLDMRVFTTSHIFVVVILFGAGTDYCLFLIARLREEASKTVWPVACRNALSGVMSALMGSAMTTVFGLAMLWFAQFGKFHYTGPVIAICLLVGLLVCTTLTPALLAAIGPKVFWPSRLPPYNAGKLSIFGDPSEPRGNLGSGLWSWVALMLTRRPLGTFFIGMGILLVPAYVGVKNENAVTYDLSSQLNHSASSRQGLRLLAQHFEMGDINPATVLIKRPEETDRETFSKQIRDLSIGLYAVPGVESVRTADDPMGDFPPDRDMGVFDSDSLRRRMLKNHSIAQRFYFSSIPEFENRLARLDVIIDADPFSTEAADVVLRVSEFLKEQTSEDQPESTLGGVWRGAKVSITGTTPSIIDLRKVTISDNRRIKVAVVIAVFAVLVLVIRRVGLCLYLIVTVLVSYYATLGLTYLFFKSAYGSDFVGLDWKLPLFLFVILVAIGQDYNVYLVTRIVEEERRLGWLAAIRRAVARTGGIITACGLVMAATFLSMTAAAWLPPLLEWLELSPKAANTALRGIVELGFALGLGVLIDTFYVRTILVPSFVALIGQWSKARS